MDFTWDAPADLNVEDAYRDWFDHVYQAPNQGALAYEIILVKIKPNGNPARMKKTLVWLKSEADTATSASDFVMDNVEMARLDRLIANPPANTDAPDIFIHRRKDAVKFAKTYKKKFEVLPDGAGRPSLPRPARPIVTDPPEPIVAVIDDAIGYLNARFARDTPQGRETRLHGVWLQTEDYVVQTGANVAMQNGTQLDSAAIDAKLALGSALDESAEYAAINEELYGKRISPIWNGITAGAGSELSVTHGTHVSDIAGGSEPSALDSVMTTCPMLAVQMPPQAIEDTSGAKLQPYVVRALRWIIAQADEMMVDGVHRPLIVNISLGVLAGSKDGTSLIERQIAAEVLRREARTAMPLRVVYAFGNDNLTRQIGYMSLSNAEPEKVTLRVQSEDYTPSFVEIRGERPEDLEIMIESLQSQPLPLGSIQAGQAVSLARNGQAAVARVYSVAPRNLDGGGQTAAFYVLAIAPTATFDFGKPLAPSGAWNIHLGTSGADQNARIGVQRDDRPQGFQALARQSYLDDHALWQWKKPEKTPYAQPADGPVTAIGSHSAWVSAQMPEQVYSVGAALGDTGFAAPYSATGAPYTKPSPEVSAIGDSSWTLRGVMASGTLSGTATSLSGTSAAAPQITRELALIFASGPDIGPWNAAATNKAREDAALAALQWSFVPTYEIDQLGAINVSRESGLRSRMDDGIANA